MAWIAECFGVRTRTWFHKIKEGERARGIREPQRIVFSDWWTRWQDDGVPWRHAGATSAT